MNKNSVDKDELEMTGAFVSFHNSWKGEAWMGDLQKKFDETMGKDNRILSTVKLNDNAQTVLYNNADINRLFAGVLDSYDDLPYRPDTAFDFCWREFEILMEMFGGYFNWKATESRSKKFEDICSKIEEYFAVNSKMAETMKQLNSHCPASAIRFMLQRLVDTDNLYEPEEDITELKDSLIVEDQYDSVSKRVSTTLGDFYELFCNKYYKRETIDKGTANRPRPTIVNTDLSADNQYKATRLFKNYLIEGKSLSIEMLSKDSNGDDVIEYKAYTYSTSKIAELIISGILYTSRCYRFHGDYFSPFKSNLSNLTRYYEYYYFLIYTYAMFWYLLYIYTDINGIEKFFTLDAVNECVERCLKRLDKLPNT